MTESRATKIMALAGMYMLGGVVQTISNGLFILLMVVVGLVTIGFVLGEEYGHYNP